MDICGYCGRQDSRALYPTTDVFGNHYEIHQCNVCHAYFLAPRPDEQRLNQAYDSSYYGEQEEKFSSSKVENVLDYFRKRRAKYVSRFIRKNENVLDIGCGNGRFLGFLKKYGDFNIYGTELDGNSAARAKRVEGLNLKVGMLEKGDFPKNNFQAITMFHVFEHLSHPVEMLDTIDEVLCPGGALVISFPNIAGLQSELFKGKWLHLDPPRHLFFFAPEDFIKLMETRGYKVLKTKYLSSEQNPYGFIQSTLNMFYKKREVLFESLKGNKEYIKEYSKFNLLFQKAVFAGTFPLFMITDLFESFFKRGATVEFTFEKSYTHSNDADAQDLIID
ncbi:MAG: hypothetical protein A2W91_01705 [Bacteroidetes bacterium GWF2_38_335]|nr:MAG: hypothetical protein A2W91_01705 [Bacteroidetes bacterium GWF2_38_335]OFY78785.1 MAG: hypothetical protein A2281_19280 [Bacteroidetes bacterium RIFOXYA12_FULL_38_20]HBS85179.1 hypothetical protein [Bacteroidales bacterium]